MEGIKLLSSKLPIFTSLENFKIQLNSKKELAHLRQGGRVIAMQK
jgi:hypothetical protein